MKTFNFCNNCGKVGHSFHQCKNPITSLGIITIRKSERGIEYLLICRKDTLGYVDFLRGRYNCYNKNYLRNIINVMTEKEKNNLLTKDFKELWNNLWGTTAGIQYRGEEKTSEEKMATLIKGVQVGDNFYTLRSLIEDSKYNWSEPEWGFPKGRRNYQEKDLECAIREWTEETGYKREDIVLVNNIMPYEEIFTGSNYKSYKHKYYIGTINDRTSSEPHFQKSEVSQLSWKTFDEAIKLIRPYNLEKVNILTRLNNVLQQYRLYT